MQPANTKPKKKRFGLIGELFRTKKLAAFSFIILVLFFLVAVFADLLAPDKMVNGQLPIDIIHKLQPPSWEHPLGTDALGHDLLSFLIYGARTSVILAVACTLISTVVSVVLGVASAVIGGWFDLILQRIVDAWQCVPGILTTMILMAMLGNGLVQLVLVISIPGGIGGCRMIRSTAYTVKDSGYMKMSTMLGTGIVWRMVKHVVPNIMPMVIMGLAGSIGGVIMMEASMNFLGFGVDANTPSWGALLTRQGRNNMYNAPWLALAPGIAIALIVFTSAMLGDGIRDIMDPRLKGGAGRYSTKQIQKIAARYAEKIVDDVEQDEEISIAQ